MEYPGYLVTLKYQGYLVTLKYFEFKNESIIDQENQSIPSQDLIHQMLQYAKELEIIV